MFKAEIFFCQTWCLTLYKFCTCGVPIFVHVLVLMPIKNHSKLPSTYMPTWSIGLRFVRFSRCEFLIEKFEYIMSLSRSSWVSKKILNIQNFQSFEKFTALIINIHFNRFEYLFKIFFKTFRNISTFQEICLYFQNLNLTHHPKGCFFPLITF